MMQYATRLCFLACLAGCASTEATAETRPADAAVSDKDTGKPSPDVVDAGKRQSEAAVTTQPAKPAEMQAAAGSGGNPSAAPAAGSGGKASAAGSGGSSAATSSEPNTGKGKGGSTQNDGKLSAFIEISDVPSGAEAHRCVVVELPNTEPVWASEFHATLTNGSHHMIVDRRDAQVELITEAELCSPSTGADATRLMIAQQHDTQLKLPEGVAFRLEAKQRIYLQMHYINTTAQPLALKGSIELTVLAKDKMPIEAKSVFTGSTSITLPAHQAGESKYFQVLQADPAWNVFAMTSHTHKLGVHSTIERVAAADAPETKPLHESRDWSEPPLNVFDKPLVFDGKDGLRLTCRYMNTTDRDVHFGTGVADEMCFMWVYYFTNESKAQK
ncbi:MAG TPA: hypothetical protein VFN67_11755 [Polyangiales bacterium]|nr:hypothetical protein [Polyangiales bacterium]